MGSLIWIKEARDMGPEIRSTQKILILEQIWIYETYDHQYDFSANLRNTKIIENFLRFPESIRTQKS
jgi:hypothetical protein